MITTDNFRDFSDEVLISRRQEIGGWVTEVLCERYLKKITVMCRQFCYSDNSRFDDLLGEAFIALFSAIGNFNPERGASFFTFLSSCVRNRLINCVHTSKISELDPAHDVPSPEHLFIEKETDESYIKSLGQFLSDLEFKVLLARLDGYSYADIAGSLSITEKSVENALSRVRGKLRPHMTG
jgi:RNA polymerase sporulation-specific sigma factor